MGCGQSTDSQREPQVQKSEASQEKGNSSKLPETDDNANATCDPLTKPGVPPAATALEPVKKGKIVARASAIIEYDRAPRASDITRGKAAAPSKRRSRFSLPNIFGGDDHKMAIAEPKDVTVVPEVMQETPIGDRRPKSLRAICRDFDLKRGYVFHAFLLFNMYCDDKGNLGFDKFCALLGLDNSSRESVYLQRAFRTVVTNEDDNTEATRDDVTDVKTQFPGFLRFAAMIDRATAGDKADFCFSALDPANSGDLKREDLEILVMTSIETMDQADTDLSLSMAQEAHDTARSSKDKALTEKVEERSHKLFSTFDANGDQKLSRAEFFRMFVDEPSVLAPFVAVFDVLGWLARQAIGKRDMSLSELMKRVESKVGSRKLHLETTPSALLQSFKECLRDGKEPMLSDEDAVLCTEILNTAEKSSAGQSGAHSVSVDKASLQVLGELHTSLHEIQSQ